MELKIGKHLIGDQHSTYFIADIAANHDGSLERAVDLISLAAQAGADAAKFQNFRGPEIVSDYGFSHMNARSPTRQSGKSVTEVYNDASVPFEWTPVLKEACDQAGIDYSPHLTTLKQPICSTPLCRPKIGSGDITWLEACLRMARKESRCSWLLARLPLAMFNGLLMPFWQSTRI